MWVDIFYALVGVDGLDGCMFWVGGHFLWVVGKGGIFWVSRGAWVWLVVVVDTSWTGGLYFW